MDQWKKWVWVAMDVVRWGKTSHR